MCAFLLRAPAGRTTRPFCLYAPYASNCNAPKVHFKIAIGNHFKTAPSCIFSRRVILERSRHTGFFASLENDSVRRRSEGSRRGDYLKLVYRTLLQSPSAPAPSMREPF